MKRKKSVQMEKTNKKRTLDIEPERERYFRHGLWRTDDELSKLAEEMIDYVTNTPNCYSITHFLVAYKLLRNSFYSWVDKSPDLFNALQFCKQIIACRREQGVLENKIPAQAVMPYMAMYCPDYKSNAEWKASLLKKDENENMPITVLLEQVKNSDLVKIRGDHE